MGSLKKKTAEKTLETSAYKSEVALFEHSRGRLGYRGLLVSIWLSTELSRFFKHPRFEVTWLRWETQGGRPIRGLKYFLQLFQSPFLFVRIRGKMFVSSAIRSCDNTSVKRSITKWVTLGARNYVFASSLVKLLPRSCNTTSAFESFFHPVRLKSIEFRFLISTLQRFASHSAVFEETRMRFQTHNCRKGLK